VHCAANNVAYFAMMRQPQVGVLLSKAQCLPSCRASHLIPHCGSSLAELLQEGAEAVGALQPHQARLASNIPGHQAGHTANTARSACMFVTWLAMCTSHCRQHEAQRAALQGQPRVVYGYPATLGAAGATSVHYTSTAPWHCCCMPLLSHRTPVLLQKIAKPPARSAHTRSALKSAS